MYRHPALIKILAVVAIVMGFSLEGSSQVLTDTADGTLSTVVVHSAMTPANTNMPTGTEVRFRIRSNSPWGYKVVAALSSFTVNAASPASGGMTITSDDIGIGIVFVDSSGSSVLKPRTDTVSSGFNYDPGSVIATNGLTPYMGVATGQATLAELGSGYKILSGPKIANTEILSANNFITVTMKFGILGQYFTPASFTAVITLSISNGQN